MYSTDNLQETACQQTVYWIERAREITGASARRLPVPEVVFDLRGRAAGQAVLARRRGAGDRIRINAALLASHPREMIDETVPHEVAHAVIHRMYGRRVRPHGKEWKALMQAFGVTAETCHKLPVEPARRLKEYRYICGCETPAWLTSIRHRRAQNGTLYSCRRCGQHLSWAG